MDQYDLFGNKIEAIKPAIKKPKAAPNPQRSDRNDTPIPAKLPEPTPPQKPAPVEAKKIELEDKEPDTPQQDKVNEQELTKVYYTISEVAKLFSVNASLLRFWEKEFKELGRIKKNKKGDRYYNKHNIRSLNVIYYLLKERKMTIAGARNMIKNKRKSTVAEFDMVENLQKIRGFLVDLKSALKEDV